MLTTSNMHLKSIELLGFKSFAKKNTFEFNSSISAVVGPNGSGKSNIAEAFRFVLGEQSIKSMRGKRGEDLIWNGATSEPRANRASVKVTLDNTQKIFDIDFPEVIVERVVHRDGLNEYSINGSVVRLKDVLELLARAHIGASGHHIISQGEADKILSASPKDRKSMVEDALGLRLFQYKRLESERKLQKTFENITQVEALRKEIAPHLKFLGKQVEKLEKTESMRGELVTLATEYFKREDIYVSFSRAKLLSERKPLNETLEKLSKESKNAKRVIELESGLSAVRKHRDDLTRELGKLEGFIMAEERVIENEKRLLVSDEFKTVRLKDVENLYEEVSLLSVVTEVISKLGNFIKDRKHSTDSRLIGEAQTKIGELKKSQVELEKSLKIAREKEQEITDAEKAVFRIMSEENELISKLNLLKAQEDKLNLEEEEFKRDLSEVEHFVGTSALHFKDIDIGDEKLAMEEDRKKQQERKHMIEKFKIRLEDSSISGMEEVHKEYKDTSERDAFLARELLDLDKSAKTLSELIKELETRLASEFSSGLESINKEFGKLFVAMFGGGEASLVLTKEEAGLDGGEKLEEGLDIKVSLPKKKIRGLMMLSGGERALTSIALIFAVSQVNPPPFIILDETDAALDESNSKKYGDLVEILSKHSQLILITHNRETMSRAGVIYGVTMGPNGISKLLSISFDEAVEAAK
ncbi:MAG: Chromosome partition protein smc [Parcubacteria group bacterium GW2011_GWD1_44_9]|nr:MAG: Chromosome partition protein smc [Parcubacteria group bacterium GW2011_GWD1_44_9]